MCSAAREVLLDTLHKSVRAGHSGVKHALIPTRQGVLTAAAAENAAAAAAAAASGAAATAASVTAAAHAARGVVKPTAFDDVDGLCRRGCRDHHRHGVRAPLEPRRCAPGRCLVALHLWPEHGCRRNFCTLSWSLRSTPGLPLVHQAQCLPSSKTIYFKHRKQREAH